MLEKKTDKTASVLVTGGAGYIGSHTCKALAAAGYNPVSLDNLTLGHRWAVRWGPLVEAELLDGAAVLRALQEHRIEAVIHFAASAYVGDSMRDPAAYYRNNMLTTLTLMDAMRTANVKDIIFSSSCSVYGNPSHVAHRRDPSDRTAESIRTDQARWRKTRCAGMARLTTCTGWHCATSTPLAPMQKVRPARITTRRRVWCRAPIMAAMGHAPPLSVFGADYPTPDGTAIRDYIHVSDLARAHVSALDALGRATPSQVLNLGTGRGYSVREVLNTVGQVVGREVPHEMAPRRAGDPAEVIADARRAGSVLGWSPRESSLQAIVATAARWHAAHNK